jgi:transcriptional regulator with XRE-family HTH domain
MHRGLGTASTGVSELDAVLGGLYWGDNVVWESEDSSSFEPFFRSIATDVSRYDHAAYVTLTLAPEEVRRTFRAFEVIDARPGSDFAQPSALLRQIGKVCDPSERILLLFDPLEAMSGHWGTEKALRFFTRSCPMLLDLGAIAYWSLSPGEHPQSLRREVEEITQCVIAVGDGRVRIAKAEGRPFGVQGSVFRYLVEDGKPALEAAPAAARLGPALRAVRLERHLSQTELARLAGVSASAVSQAERGHRGLSLDTLLNLTARLGITLDELLRGEVAPGYRLARRHDLHQQADGKTLALLDDPEAGLRAYLVRLPPGESAELGFAHKGVELIAVATGLVQIVLPTGRPVLRQGEALLAERSGILSCRNLVEHEAVLFWILRDRIEERKPTS